MLDYKITKEILDSEKITRKKTSGFIKKILRYLGFDLYYPTFKRIIYAEEQPKSTNDKKIKAIYDSFIYLVSNAKQELTKEVLNKFLYILKQEEFTEDEILKMQTAYYYPCNDSFKKIVNFHFKLLGCLTRFNEIEKKLISFMLLNYSLLNNEFGIVQFTFKQYKQYEKVVKSEDENEIYDYFYELVTTQLMQDKDYYNNLIELTKEEIVQKILENKEKLKEKYKFRKMFLFGSFASDEVRFDSDIDLLVEFEEEQSLIDKKKHIKDFLDEYQDIFKRFIDVHELGKYVQEDLILTIKKTIEIY